MKYQLNPQFTHCEPLILNIDDAFAASDQVLQEARNTIKKVSFEGVDYVVKSFKKPNLLNQLLYTFARQSKACRSYQYSLKISQFVPRGVAYVEFFNAGLITKSYFISECFDYDFTIREVLTDPEFSDREAIYRAFAQFTYQLHEQGILHRDYSPGNILIKRQDSTYIFKIIDINRMSFKAMTIPQRMKNFYMLWASDSDMTLIAKEYARQAKLDERQCIALACEYNQKNKRFKNFKKRLKGRPVTR